MTPGDCFYSPMPPYFKPSPVDCFGYRYKCCHCITLRIGVMIICVLSCLWATIELSRTDSLTKSIFLGVDPLFLAIARAAHVFVVVVFLISCGILMIGVIIQRAIPIRVYVWVAFIFNCICIILTVLSVSFQLILNAKLSRKLFMTVVFAVVWYSFCFYFINVVNSYRAVLVGEDVLYSE